MNKLLIISASTRPQRLGTVISEWVQRVALDIAATDGNVEVELTDLAEVNLPFLDEVVPAAIAQQEYQNEHTLRWSQRVAQADGFVFVLPEYNHSYPASIKNAIDYLFVEWNYKPLGMVSYGASKAVGWGAKHLRTVAGELCMYDVRDYVLIPDCFDRVDDKGNFHPLEYQNADAKGMITEVIRAIEPMKLMRV
ncbi:NADPH-dependent FMN reductase [Spirochaeta africana]|uniref:Putative flavoprotein n=1 Tax=Spirochaeta africana (strain ATCC 700263 / DSM 8902 / Z-7692) TaxID=889378 RepID=H9UG50_SPIAZ|nr:NAD(P)H-dependent oxidoreductase [Spirochaeta africana]AFG36493.1 putative flavoprotein [Spirochaeta africana DSM 8902]